MQYHITLYSRKYFNMSKTYISGKFGKELKSCTSLLSRPFGQCWLGLEKGKKEQHGKKVSSDRGTIVPFIIGSDSGR
jgi:hypothetical protein